MDRGARCLGSNPSSEQDKPGGLEHASQIWGTLVSSPVTMEMNTDATSKGWLLLLFV